MSAEYSMSITLQSRKAVKKIMDSLSAEQLNLIPAGFKNNIIWNCAHIISIQQTLIYGLGNQTFLVSEDQINEFTIGTTPTTRYGTPFIDHIKGQLVTTFAQTIEDVRANKFNDFRPFTTALRFEITDIESALAFNQYHEALHMGYIMGLRKFV